MVRVLTAVVMVLASALVTAVPAVAAYPGQNGKIAALNAAGPIVLIDPASGGVDPIGGAPFLNDLTWSPDGARIAYHARTGPEFSDPADIRVIDADGTDDTTLAADPADDRSPSWSPDGTQIVFESTRAGGFGVRELHTMNADGTNVQRLTNLEELEGQARSPAWSPDGTKIAYIGRLTTAPWRVRVINADGTGDHAVTPEGFSSHSIADRLDWAPDASRIMVEGGFAGDGREEEFWTVEPDGDNLAPLPNTADHSSGDFPWVAHQSPRFSPDGARIVFASREYIPEPASFPTRLLSQRLDGTDRRTEAEPTDENDSYYGPDWQPVPVTGYARPKSASPLHVSLIVAFPECTAPNKVHGPPLEHPSCGDNFNPPSGNSQHATVGTPDWNGAPAKFTGILRIGVQVGDPATPADEADLRLRVTTTDIRCRPAAAPATCGASNIVGADYAGELQARVAMRITDKDNAPAPGGAGAGTTVDMPYSFTVPCMGTADNNVGSGCEVETTADALVPDTVKEGDRSVWQLGEVEVLDGGPDGDVDTSGGAHVFLRQGVFVP